MTSLRTNIRQEVRHPAVMYQRIRSSITLSFLIPLSFPKTRGIYCCTSKALVPEALPVWSAWATSLRQKNDVRHHVSIQLTKQIMVLNHINLLLPAHSRPSFAAREFDFFFIESNKSQFYIIYILIVIVYIVCWKELPWFCYWLASKALFLYILFCYSFFFYWNVISMCTIYVWCDGKWDSV